jgi:hypothetical protein
MFFLLVSSPLSSLLLVLERQELALVIHSLILVTRVAALLVGALADSVYLALGLWSGTGALVYGGLAMWNLKLSKVPLRVAGRILVRYGSYAFPVIAVVLALKLWLGSLPWLILVVAAAMLVAYGLLVLRRNRVLYNYLTSASELKPQWKHVVKCTLRGRGD